MSTGNIAVRPHGHVGDVGQWFLVEINGPTLTGMYPNRRGSDEYTIQYPFNGAGADPLSQFVNFVARADHKADGIIVVSDGVTDFDRMELAMGNGNTLCVERDGLFGSMDPPVLTRFVNPFDALVAWRRGGHRVLMPLNVAAQRGDIGGGQPWGILHITVETGGWSYQTRLVDKTDTVRLPVGKPEGKKANTLAGELQHLLRQTSSVLVWVTPHEAAQVVEHELRLYLAEHGEDPARRGHSQPVWLIADPLAVTAGALLYI